MSRRPSPSQPDLFSSSAAAPAPDGLRDLLRLELRRMLEAAERHGASNWPDITAATVAELRFNAMAAGLPAEEAAALRAAHDAALDRYYESLSPPL